MSKRQKSGGVKSFKNIFFLIFLASPPDFARVKTCVVVCGAQNFFANTIVTGNSP
jgi:hypothetical protein